MNENTPTVSLPVVAAAPATKRGSRGPVGGLVAITAALALAVVAVGVVVLNTPAAPATVNAQDSDLTTAPVSAHPAHILLPQQTVLAPQTPIAEPADTAVIDPDDEQNVNGGNAVGLAIVAFSTSNTTVLCNTQAPSTSHQYISFGWNVTGATQVFFGVDTTDAQAEPMFTNLALNGVSSTGFPPGYENYEYACPEASHTYALTAIDGHGHKVSRSVTIVNNGDTSY